MRNLKFSIYIAPVLLGLVFSCATPAERVSGVESESDLIEITPFIVDKVMIYDTTQLKNLPDGMLPRDYMEIKGTHFLNQAGLNAFREQMQHNLMNPNSLIYHSPFDKTALTQTEKRDKYRKCDSIIETGIDEKGNEVANSIFLCDTTSLFYQMNAINFYESWYYNKRTSEIVKKQLGYSVWQFDTDKQAFRELFIYFVSDEARKKAIKYL